MIQELPLLSLHAMSVYPHKEAHHSVTPVWTGQGQACVPIHTASEGILQGTPPGSMFFQLVCLLNPLIRLLRQGALAFAGTLVLKYEDSNGKARLNVSNTGNLLQRFRDHVVSGWALYPDGAVMYIIPPKPRRMDSPSPSGSPMPAGLDDDGDGVAGGVGNIWGSAGSLHDLIEAAHTVEADGGSFKQEDDTAIGTAEAAVTFPEASREEENSEEVISDESDGEEAGEKGLEATGLSRTEKV